MAVIYPGSFDPPHNGHVDIVQQAVDIFGDVVVAAMYNPEKHTGMFTLDERLGLLEQVFGKIKNVKVVAFPGLAIDAAAAVSATAIVKGVRNAGDFDIEQQMAQTNFAVSNIRTVYLPSDPALSFISSRFIREIAQYGGDVSSMVPPAVAKELKMRFPQKGEGR